MKTRQFLYSTTMAGFLALPFLPTTLSAQGQEKAETVETRNVHDLILTIGSRSADIDEIIGTEALSITDESIGEVVDAVFDRSTGKAVYLVVSEDALINSQRALIPIEAIASEELPLSTEEDQTNIWDGMELRLATTEEQFSDLAVLDEKMSIKQYLADQGPILQKFFAPRDVEGRSPSSIDPDNLVFSKQLPSKSHSQHPSKSDTVESKELVTTSSGWESMKVDVGDRQIEARWLIGAKVIDRDGNAVGEVKDIANQSNGEIPIQIVVSTDNWLDGRVALIDPNEVSYHDGSAPTESTPNLVPTRQNQLVLHITESEFDRRAQYQIAQNQLKPISDKPQS